jgi:hypothetical protein
VSVCVSSLIPSAIGQPGRLSAMAAMCPQGLPKVLGAVADPRKKRGVRHRFVLNRPGSGGGSDSTEGWGYASTEGVSE